MPAIEYTVQNLCGFLIRSKLVAPEESRTIYQRWLAEAKDLAGNAGAFLKWLVNGHIITEYQASLLARGHVDDFYLNQYLILERIGRGRMAGVYKGRHSLGQTVAIKVLPPSKSKNPQLLARFQRESRLALRLKHANVVRTFQIGETRGLHYLIMEYLEGDTLEEVLQKRKRLAPQEAVHLVHQALQGLQHLHERSMVHRDLKPANLMLVPPPSDTSCLQCTVKILDIGLGREIFDESNPAVGDNADLTSEGVLLGTPDYLSPEQARDPRSIDVRADIYSLGCVLYHALTGQPPFPDKNLLNQLVRHATETPRPVRELNPAVPEGLQQILNWMMAKDPGQRYPTPERAAQALQVFLVAGSTAAKPLEEQPQMRRYLTWLETSQPEEEDSEADTAQPQPSPLARKAEAGPPAPIAGPPPTLKKTPMPKPAPAVASTAVAVPATMPSPLGSAADARVARKKHATLPLGTRASPETIKSADIDVELVPVSETTPDTETAGSRFFLKEFSRRDWMLVGAGAGVVLLIFLLGKLFSLI